MSGRIRTIKPELLEDERVASLSDGAFRLFIAAILSADDHGNFRAEPRQLRGVVYWAQDGILPNTVQDYREELLACGLIHGYRVRGQTYCHISGWAKHQRMDNAGKPRMPRPDDPEAESFGGCAPATAPDPESPQTGDQALSVRFAANFREPPPTSDERGSPSREPPPMPPSSPLAQSRGVSNDHRSTTTDPEGTLRARPRDPAGDYELGVAWARGVTSGSGKPTSRPPRGEVHRLVGLVDAHCADRSLPARAEWAESEGCAYGEAARDRTRNVFKFGEWFENGRSFGSGAGVAEAPLRPILPARPSPMTEPAMDGRGAKAALDEAMASLLGRNVVSGA